MGGVLLDLVTLSHHRDTRRCFLLRRGACFRTKDSDRAAQSRLVLKPRWWKHDWRTSAAALHGQSETGRDATPPPFKTVFNVIPLKSFSSPHFIRKKTRLARPQGRWNHPSCQGGEGGATSWTRSTVDDGAETNRHSHSLSPPDVQVIWRSPTGSKGNIANSTQKDPRNSPPPRRDSQRKPLHCTEVSSYANISAAKR